MAAPTNARLSAERTANPGRFTAECTRALSKAKGNVSEAARALDVTRRTLTRYIKESPSLRAALREARKS